MELIDTVMSGNGWKVRLLAGYCGIALQRRSLSILDGDLETESFADINPLRQIPVLKTREGAWLAESTAILWYLGEGTSFLPEGKLQRAQILQWLLFEQTRLMWNLAQPRLWLSLRKSMHPDDPAIQRWHKRGYESLDILEGQLLKQDFAALSQPTIADVALYPYVRMADQGGYDMERFPRIAAWLARMRSIPGYVPLIEDVPATD